MNVTNVYLSRHEDVKELAERIGKDIGSLGKLTTTNKENIVAAINEIKQAQVGITGRIEAIEEHLSKPLDQGPDSEYPGTGWYKATDTGIVYNVGVPEGRTYTFEGDPTEYISVWHYGGLDLSSDTDAEEVVRKVTYWHNNLHRFATSNVTDMSYWLFMFGNTQLYGALGVSPDDINTDSVDISHYDTSNVTDMSFMFYAASEFNQPLDNFDTSKVTSMSHMFSGASAFNQPLDNFVTSNVTDVSYMFKDASSFNQDLSTWDTSSVTDLSGVFSGATSFNGDVTTWDTSKATRMNETFSGATSFNQSLATWDTSSATAMFDTFAEATAFNKDISSWDTSNATNMHSMFRGATSFNQDISSWDTSKVAVMVSMFEGATSFNQDLSQWCVPLIENVGNSFDRGASAWTKPRPVWGTCPRGEDGA